MVVNIAASTIVTAIAITIATNHGIPNEDEIKTMVTVGQREGVLGEEEKEMIHSIFKFTDTRAFEAMIPSTDMVCLEADATVEEALDIIKKTGHSRIPVYQGRMDNMVGIVYAKDLLSHFKNENYQLKHRNLVRPPYFIPETKRVPSLLKEFQKRRIQMALVVDEYGGIEGLITLEDLVEEIVGEIPPEYRKEKRLIERIDKHTLKVSGRLEIDEANRVLKLRLPENGFETIGGFIFNLIGRIPKEGEEIAYRKLSFIIEKATPKRILYVRIKRK